MVRVERKPWAGLFRVVVVLGLALLAFVFAAIGYNTWNESRGGAGPDWLILAIPGAVAIAVFLAVLKVWFPDSRAGLLSGGLVTSGLLGGLVAALAIGQADQLGGGVLSLALLLGLGVVAAAVSIPAILPWWRRTDEAARQAHLSGFFWGASVGAVVVTPVILAPMLHPGSVRAVSSLTPDQAFFAGAAALYGAITLGYGLFWAWWWLRKR